MRLDYLLQVAERSGLKTQYSFQPFKGKYWKHKNPDFTMRLVYPVPDLSLPFLGVHTAHNQTGDVYRTQFDAGYRARELSRPGWHQPA